MEPKTDIMADARGFMKSRVILTAADLDFFTRLDGNFLTAAELIGDRDLYQRATTRILDCLVAARFGYCGRNSAQSRALINTWVLLSRGFFLKTTRRPWARKVHLRGRNRSGFMGRKIPVF